MQLLSNARSLVLCSCVAGFVGAAAGQTAPALASIPGTFAVTSGGSARYAIDLALPAGTAGLAPSLTLTYDSQFAGSNAGAGWTLSGLSAITRGPRSHFSDARTSGVSLGDDDALYLDSQRLIAVETQGAGAAQRTEYRKEVDDQTRIIRVGASLQTASFVVETKGGVRLHFTGAGNSNVKTSDGAVLLWLVSRTSDTAGNFMEFRYNQNALGDYSIAEVAYTGLEALDGAGIVTTVRVPYAKVSFEYGAAPRQLESFIAGRRIVKDGRLLRISSSVAGLSGEAPARGFEYRFEYEDRQTASRFVMTRVRMFAPDGVEVNPTDFNYSVPTAGWTPAAFQLPIGAVASKRILAPAFRFSHFSEKGAAPDLLFSVAVDGTDESYAFTNEGGTWKQASAFKPPVPFASADGTDLGVMVLDVSGDGRADILQSYRKGDGGVAQSAYLAGKDAWTPAAAYKLPFVLSDKGKRSAIVTVGAFTGSSRKDLVYLADGVRGLLRNTGSGWQAEAPPLFQPTTDDLAVDADCDGTPEYLVYEAGAWRAWKYSGSAWVRAAGLDLPLPVGVPRAAVRILATEGSPCQALIASSAQAGVRKAHTASATGWQENKELEPTFDLVDATGTASLARAVDVNKDGSDDIIAHAVSNAGAVQKFAYRQTAAGWEPFPAAYALPVLDDLRRVAASESQVIDLDGDGYPDIITPDGPGSNYASVFAGSSGGFEPKTIYVPDVLLAVKDKQDAGVRFVDLNGDGLPDILFHRSVTAGGTTTVTVGARLNTGNGWVDAPNLAPPSPFSAEYITGNPVQFVDVDMDGYVDALYHYQKADGSVVRSFWHNVADEAGGRKWAPLADSPYSPPAEHPFAREKLGDLGVRLVDVNGDGQVDLLVGTVPARASEDVLPYKCETNPDTSVETCVLNRELFQTTAFINTAAGWVREAGWKPPLPYVYQRSDRETTTDLSVQMVDVDGDTLPDVVARFQHPYDASREVNEVWLNTGAGWRLSPSIQAPALLDTSLRNPRALYQWIDLNSDGLQDLVYTERDGSSNSSSTWLNTGAGFVAKADWQIPLDAIADRGGDTSFRLIDLNGDGRPDIISARKNGAETVAQAYSNTGSGWFKLPDASVAAAPAFIDENGLDQGVRILDVDGNGLPDLVRSYADGPNLAATQQAVLLNSGTRADVLVSVAAGFGMVTTLEYQSLLERRRPHGLGLWSRVYERTINPTAPLFSPVPMLYVVRRSSVEGAGAARSSSYRYGDFMMDLRAMRTLGFKWRESLDEQGKFLTREDYEASVDSMGRLNAESRCWLKVEDKPAGGSVPANLCPQDGELLGWVRRLQATNFGWDVKFRGTTPTDPKGRLRQVALSRSVSSSWELDGLLTARSTTELKYDEPADLKDRRLNAVETLIQRIDGTSVRTANEYADDASRWHLGRLVRSTTTREGDIPVGETARTREVLVVSYTYAADTGLLRTSTTNPGDPLALTTTLDRDASGNIVATTLSAIGHPTRRASTKFDSLGRFIIETANAAGHKTTFERRVLDGKTTRSVDANGFLSTFRYDSIGRLSGSTSVGGIVTAVDRIAAATAPGWLVKGLKAEAVQVTRVGSLPPSYKVFDALGRLIRSSDAAFTLNDTSQRWTNSDMIYDDQSRPVRVSLPHFADQNPTGWLEVTYDPLGREVERRRDGRLLSQIVRAGRPLGGSIEKTIDALGNQTVREINARGQQVAAEDALGRRSNYGFDAGDRLQVIRGPLGATTRLSYDAFGRRNTLVDPDMGRWTYKYDAFGQLVEQVDAKGQVTLQEFDTLGRIMRRSSADGEFTQWEYDTAVRGIGEIKRIRHAQYDKEFFYDAVGLVRATTVSIGSETFTTVHEHDEYERVKKIRYPAPPGQSPLVAEYVFDRKGFLRRVTEENGVRTYWEALDMDASGRLLKERSGNGVTTARVYSAADGSLATLKAMGQSGVIYDLALQYGPSGNLITKTESGKRETFEYDAADQLVTHKQSGATRRFAYDEAGRIKEKTGAGSFNYRSDAETGPWQPFYGATGIRNGATTEGLEYDANGNLTRDGSAQYTYTADNQLASVRSGSRQLSFDYGPASVRYRQVATDGNKQLETLYVGGLEVMKEGNGSGSVTATSFVAYIRNYSGPVAMVVRKVKAGSTTAETAVLYPTYDQLGSVVRVTNAQGQIVSRSTYDPWGGRSQQGGPATYGFTSHEHLALAQLVHMNGRVYSARMGAFMSADAVGMDLMDPGALGRYRYAYNNPLKYTDPTGYWSLGGALAGAIGGFLAGGPGGAITGAFIGGNDETREFVEEHWKEAVIVGVAVGVTFATGGACAAACGAIVSGMAAGAASGATAAALYGGSVDDVFAAAAKGAVIGGFSAGAFYGVGSAFNGAAGSMTDPNSFGAVAAHGAVGGATSSLQGGNFWTGFLSAAATKSAETWGPAVNSVSAGVTRAAVVGGTVSVLSGGKFANGAVIGVFSFSFNCLLHECLKHYMGGTGKPMEAKFSELDADEVSLEDFPKIKRLASSKADGTYEVEATTGWQTKSTNSKYAYGRVTLKVSGTLTVSQGRASFTGKLSALPDQYDFNRDSSRGWFADALTSAGRQLPGKSFEIKFEGSRPLQESWSLQPNVP